MMFFGTHFLADVGKTHLVNLNFEEINNKDRHSKNFHFLSDLNWHKIFDANNSTSVRSSLRKTFLIIHECKCAFFMFTFN